MQTLRTVAEFRQWRSDTASRGPLALVPTMGALHEGHLDHVRVGKGVAARVAVSIFVNPTQFGPAEDFARYPRPFDADVEKCTAAGADAVFAPEPGEVYPRDALDAQVDVPALTTILEGAHRPGHFAGVCRVVAKLLMIAQPDAVTFGRKDYQQLRVVEAMIRDLMIPVRIVEVPTRREADGLAMSSRNAYLPPEDRKKAAALFKALTHAKHLVEEAEETDPAAVERAMADVLTVHGLTVDYATVRHPATLQLPDCLEPSLTGGVVALIAARLGSVRLIDNMLLGA